ncbi:hypothetical protein Srubr_40830 [Streptomyces rubradiris]|uniref:Uncharacterized protein n=1 Tax=Streptomyces rubradiris TaxID=285531 RepID=A0ABQ3REE2_STRRR|nr:hypothetical protein GCM10018792_11440 [Streptomyces rubradiris]GHI54237.1 hypothetical protein Srubr_40830 [Streptomyces rubradiris]
MQGTAAAAAEADCMPSAVPEAPATSARAASSDVLVLRLMSAGVLRCDVVRCDVVPCGAVWCRVGNYGVRCTGGRSARRRTRWCAVAGEAVAVGGFAGVTQPEPSWKPFAHWPVAAEGAQNGGWRMSEPSRCGAP